MTQTPEPPEFLGQFIVVCGTLAEFETPHGINGEKYTSFELLRRQLIGPELITFDELLERARMIVDAA